MIEVMAFDPGETTGIATFDSPNKYGSMQIEPRKYPHPHEALYDVISEQKPATMVYEAFHHRQLQYGAVFTGIEYIGVIKLYAQLQCIECIEISPSDGKGFWTDSKLKMLGLFKTGRPHANDAMRLTLRYKMKTDKVWFDDIVEKLRVKLQNA